MLQDLLANAKTSNTFAQVTARDTLNGEKEALSSSNEIGETSKGKQPN